MEKEEKNKKEVKRKDKENKRNKINFLTFFIILIFFLYFCISFSSFSFADETTQIKNAYSWLKAKLFQSIGSFSSIELAFSILALSDQLTVSQMNAVIAIFNSKSSNGCWKKDNNCDALSTAIVNYVTALLGIESDAEKWLESASIEYTKEYTKKTDINQYLQIIPVYGNSFYCLINTDGSSGEVYFDSSGNITNLSGLEDYFDISNYWLLLKSYEKFSIECNESVKVALIFGKLENGKEIYVLSDVAELNPSYQIEIEPKTPKCVAVNGNCNYEATLWTALGFHKRGKIKEANRYLLYLISNYNENRKYYPEVFLYALTNRNSFKSDALKQHTKQGLLKAKDSSYNEYYDTALAKMNGVLDGLDISFFKKVLLENQSKEGYWAINNSVIETALLLRAFWPGFTGLSECEASGFSCVDNCSALAGNEKPLGCNQGICCDIPQTCIAKQGTCKSNCSANETEVNYECSSGKCCKPLDKSLCEAEVNGKVCKVGEECIVNGVVSNFLYTSDTPNCCLGECSTPQKKCSDVGGVICSPPSKTCANGKWLQATDSSFCCKPEACIEEPKECSFMNGKICNTDEICKGILVEAADTKGEKTCCVRGSCIPKECKGEKCESDESCNSTMYETSDALKCCSGKCLKTCSNINGEVCDINEGYECDGEIKEAYDTKFCCVGECKLKKGFPWWSLIIIIIILAVISVLFVLYKKGIIKFKKKQTQIQYQYQQYQQYQQYPSQ